MLHVLSHPSDVHDRRVVEAALEGVWKIGLFPSEGGQGFTLSCAGVATDVNEPGSRFNDLALLTSRSLAREIESVTRFSVERSHGNRVVARESLYGAAFEPSRAGSSSKSDSNERIAVKTVTTSSHVSFNASTFECVDRVIVLRVNVDDELGISVEELLDETAEAAKGKMHLSDGKFVYTIAQGNQRAKRPVEDLRVTARARHSELEIVRYESGAIRILRDGAIQPVVVKDVLRPIAAGLGVSLLNPKGENKNTQALGADVIRALNLRSNHPGA